jgi:VCBS repeat-containing protein
MPANYVHRIYTEDKNKSEILRLASTQFESFMVQPTDGYYQGKHERSIVLEIAGAQQRQVEKLAEQIRHMNGQKSVLILKTRGTATATRR